ncbi:MAG: hypothetical protein EXR80_05190 [Methylococcales bacterium]|nr:hypothetical protein [Methylococcales bacterium]
MYQKYTPLPNETVLIISPIRNIESWFHYINTGGTSIENIKPQYHKDGKPVLDKNGNHKYDVDDHKRDYQDAKPTKFAKILKDKICINRLPQNVPSSLHRACNEFNRL